MKEKKCENLKMNAEVSNAENVDLKKMLKDKIELVDQINSELLSTNEKLKDAEEEFVKIKSELDKVNEPQDLQCQLCHDRFKTYSQVKLHVRKVHFQNKVTQFDEIFLQYNCFYSNFFSRNNLEEHPTDCHIQLNQIPSEIIFVIFVPEHLEM